MSWTVVWQTSGWTSFQSAQKTRLKSQALSVWSWAQNPLIKTTICQRRKSKWCNLTLLASLQKIAKARAHPPASWNPPLSTAESTLMNLLSLEIWTKSEKVSTNHLSRMPTASKNLASTSQSHILQCRIVWLGTLPVSLKRRSRGCKRYSSWEVHRINPRLTLEKNLKVWDWIKTHKRWKSRSKEKGSRSNWAKSNLWVYLKLLETNNSSQTLFKRSRKQVLMILKLLK